MTMFNPLKPSPFSPTSRYAGIETARLELPGGRTVVYLKRRFVPPAERFDLLVEHTVQQGERPDTVAALYFGDPEQFWRLCDANNVLRPEDLTGQPGKAIRITLPEGVPGNSHGG